MSENETLKSPLVGQSHRNPGKFILERLPAGAELELEPEPENPYDGCAIKVLVRAEEVPEGQRETLRETLVGAMQDWDEICERQEPIWIGYLAASDGAPLRKAREGTDSSLVGNREIAEALAEAQAQGAIYRVELDFDMTGRPLVVVTLTELYRVD